MSRYFSSNNRLLLSAFIAAFTLTSHPLSLSFCFSLSLALYFRYFCSDTYDTINVDIWPTPEKKICTTEGKTYLLPWYTSLLNLVFFFHSLSLLPHSLFAIEQQWNPTHAKKNWKRWKEMRKLFALVCNAFITQEREKLYVLFSQPNLFRRGMIEVCFQTIIKLSWNFTKFIMQKVKSFMSETL